MTRNLWRRLIAGGLIALSFFLFATTRILAQQTLGAIVGSVSDSSSSLIPGTEVTVTSEQTGFTRTIRSNQNGEYQFLNLAIGAYIVTFSHEGFETAKYPRIGVQENRNTSLNAVLKTGSVATSVTVNATPMLNAVDTTNGYVLDSTQIEQVSLATGSFTQLATLAPGVNAQLLNGTGSNTGLGNQAIWANGQRDTSNTFQVNGVDASNLFNGKSNSQESSARVVPNTGESFANGGVIRTNTSVYDAIGESLPSPPPETIEEMRVNTSMYDAGQGSTSGAHIDLNTKTGANAVHGQGWLYRQTDWLNAAPFFYKQQSVKYGGSIPLDQVTPQLHRFTSGATVGGPIIQNKLFYFLSYQAVRVADQLSGTSSLAVPVQQGSALGLTDDRSAQTLADLANADFGTHLAASDVNSTALAILSAKLPDGKYLVPSAQQAGQSASFSNVTLFGKPTFSADQATGALNWNVSKADTLAAKYYWQHDPSVAPYGQSQVDGFQQFLDAGSHVASLTNAILLGNRLNWSQTLGFAREKAYSANNQALSPSSVGMNLLGSAIFPGISISNDAGTTGGIVPAGLNIGPTGSFSHQGVFQNRISPSSDVTYALGRHNLTFGANYGYTQLNVINRRTETATLTSRTFSDFLTGTLRNNRSSLLLGSASRYYRANQVGSYVQDKWQIMPNLSITAGVRYDWNGPLTEKYGNFFNFDPSLYQYDLNSDTIVNDGFIIAGNNKQYHTPGVSDSTLKARQWGFAPRIGAAWAPDMSKGKVVFRAGTGLYYDRGEYFVYLSPGAGSGISGPFGVTQEPPFVIPFNSPSGSNLSAPFGTSAAALPVPSGNPADFAKYLPNRASIINGDTTYPFGAYDIHNKLPYTINVTFDMQYQPRNDIAITIGYVGNLGRHGVLPLPFNQPGIATADHPINGETSSYGYQALDPAGNPLTTEPYYTYDGGNTDLRVPYLGYGVNAVSYRAAGVSSYNALQAHVDKRLSHGFQLGASYTWSHSLDEQSAVGLYFNGNNPNKLRDAYANSDFDRTHVFNFLFSYQIPGVKEGPSWTKWATSGWGLSGITVLESGQPYSVVDYTGAVGSLYYSTNDGITNPILPLKAGVSPRQALTGHSGAYLNADGSAIPALNPAAFTVPLIAPGTNGVPTCGVSTAGAPVCDIFETGFSTGQRNIFREAFQKRADVSLVKLTKFTERVSAKYTFDVYNVTNTSSFDIPGNTASVNSNYNAQPTYDATLTASQNVSNLYTLPAVGIGQVSQIIGGPRNIQMSLHLIF